MGAVHLIGIRKMSDKHADRSAKRRETRHVHVCMCVCVHDVMSSGTERII